MSFGSREVEPNRYREDIGRYYEDFEVGAIYEHRPGRTINEADNSWFTLLTMNTHPLHFDTEYASHSEFGRPFVNSCLTLSMVAGISVSDTSQKAIANLGWTDIKMPIPSLWEIRSTPDRKCSRKRESNSAQHEASSGSDAGQEPRRSRRYVLR